jgi:transcription factor IIIB subunit 2
VCGYIFKENNIVNEITFSENASGTSTVVGTFVPSSGAKGLSSSAKQPKGYSRESREQTLANGKRKIQQLASALHITNHNWVEAAHRTFQLAVQSNFIQGRKTSNVIAACLYTVCRRERTNHMLLDFSGTSGGN